MTPADKANGQNGVVGWFKRNVAVVVMVGTQLVVFTIWLTKIDDRIAIIETRGSPQFQEALNRLVIIEERQRVALEAVKTSGTKLDALLDVSQQFREQLKERPPR